MQIIIIGAGNMARGIATRALAGGHDVTILAKDDLKAAQLADDLRAQAVGEGVVGASASASASGDSAIDAADVVVLAVPFAAAKQLVSDYGARLDGKIVIDISNPVNAALDALVVEPGTSAAEEIAWLATPGARIVKAFNTTFAGTLPAGSVGGEPLDVFIAADDESARKQVAELVASGGLNPVDVGALKHARGLEGFQLLHMALQLGDAGYGWMSGIRIAKPRPAAPLQ